MTLEKRNIRYLRKEELDESPDLAVVDVSFISLTLVFPKVIELLKPVAQILALIKPQFEVGRDQVGKGGVVRDPEKHRLVVEKIRKSGEALGLRVSGITESPIMGPKGNREFLIHFLVGESMEAFLD